MKLIPPAIYDAAGRPLRPMLNAMVSICDPNSAVEWPFFLRIRLDGYDLATTPRTLPLSPMTTTLVTRQAGHVAAYPIVLEPLDGPLVTWRIMYSGTAVAQDIRAEWRNDQVTLMGFVTPPLAGDDQRVPIITYDFSPSALRFFLPWRIDLGAIVHLRLKTDAEWVEGPVSIVRRDPTVIWWNKQQGYQAVGRWEGLSENAAHRWRTFCWRHQPAPMLGARAGS